MGMFLHYQDIASNYTPNNLIKAFPTDSRDTKLDPIDASKPYEEYNAKGELEGYFWRYGDTVVLEFNIDGELTVESDAIVVYSANERPTSATVGNIGQRYYNVRDLKSYTCMSRDNKVYSWVEDDTFTYPTSSDRSIYISAEDFLKDKSIVISLYNFRYEQIYESTFTGTPRVAFEISRELSDTLVRGVYYCSLKVCNDAYSSVIFEPSDCRLLVK